MLTSKERAAFFKMLADYKRNWITTSDALKTVESIVRAARAQELRDTAVAWYEDDYADSVTAITDWLRDRAETIDNGLG